MKTPRRTGVPARLGAALVLAFLVTFPAAADRITLKTGGVLEGEILGETAEAVTLKASYGTVEIARDRIAAIARRRYAPPPRRPEASPGSSQGVFAPPPVGMPPATPAAPRSEEKQADLEARLNTALAAFTAFEHSREAEIAADGLVAQGKDMVPLLIQKAPALEPVQQKWLIDVLRLIADPRAADMLLGMVNSPKGEVQSAAAKALAALKEPRAVKPLIHLLDGGDWTVRRDACTALEQLGDKAAVPALIARLSDVNLFVRGRAHDALKGITEEDFPSDPEPWREWLAAHPVGGTEKKDITGRPIDTTGGNKAPEE